MASPSRPRFSVPRRAPGRNPARPQDAGQALISMLPDLLNRMAAPRMAARAHLPSSAAPEKCRLNMTVSEFRAWQHSMEWWGRLNGWNAVDALGHIRLLCVPELQRVLDNKYGVDRWAAMSPQAAMDAIKQIAVLPANKAAEWDKFFSIKQSDGESIDSYFHRATQITVDCEFQCPGCSGVLSE